MTDLQYADYRHNPRRLVCDILAELRRGPMRPVDMARRLFHCDSGHANWQPRYRMVYAMLRRMVTDGMIRRVRGRYSCVKFSATKTERR